MNRKQGVTKNWMEWMVFGISTLLVVATFTYLIYDALRVGTGPPSIEVRLGEAQPGSGGYVIPVTILNSGDRTAEQVAIQVDLKDGGEEESATLDLDFVPRRAERKGWVVFSSDPRTADSIRAYARSFKEP